MQEKYLLCPQCGFNRFYVDTDGKSAKYFHVDYALNPVPTKQSNDNLEGADFSLIFCTACSWSGGLLKLVKSIS